MAAAPTPLRFKENDNTAKNNSELKTEDVSANSLDYPRRVLERRVADFNCSERCDPLVHLAHELS